MKTKQKTLVTMKNLVLIFLLLSGFSYAQIPLNEPTPYEVCDGPEMDGIGLFDLASKNAEILGALSPNAYTVSYHETLTDSQTGAYPQNSSYANINTLFNQTLFVRVTEIADPTYYGLTTLNLVVNAPPSLPGAIPDLIVNEFPFDSFANFDLNLRYSNILNNQTGMNVSYFNSLNDATNNLQIIVNPSSYGNTSNPQTIYARIENNITGCFSVTSFQIVVQEGIAITNPTPLEVCSTGINGTGNFDLLLKNAEILGALSPTEYTLSYHETQADSQLGLNPINTSFPYMNIVPYIQTLWVRVVEIVNSTNFDITPLQIIVNDPPTVPGSVSNLIIYENPYDGSALFDLTIKDNEINNSPSTIINYYTSLSDAQNDTSTIINETTYLGTHLQTIYARVLNTTTGCISITSFILKVLDSNLVVYIPDTNFKAKLISANSSNQVAQVGVNFVPIDTNSDGEIQFTEAILIEKLDVSNCNAGDLTGIEHFTSLTTLNCSNNNLTSLDVTTLSSLIELTCNLNQLSSLNLNGLNSLENLNCYSNQLSDLSFSTLTNLRTIDCSNNLISSLSVSNLAFLEELSCRENITLNSLILNNLPALKNLFVNNTNIGNIDVTPFTQLEYLDCSNINLTSLDLTNSTNLKYLFCFSNQLLTLNTSSCPNLEFLHCGDNLLTTLDLSANVNLGRLFCWTNELISLDLSNLTQLTEVNCQTNLLTSVTLGTHPILDYFRCDENQIESLNTTGSPNLTNLWCSNNNLIDLNLSQNTTLQYLYCTNNLFTTLDCNSNSGLINLNVRNNPNLESLFIKNGAYELNGVFSPTFENCPNLVYVCADEGEINYISSDYPSLNVSTYCNIPPGGNYNTITGALIFDSTSNGCDNLDTPYSNIRINITDGTNTGATFTDTNGNYTLYTDAGNYTLSPEIENSEWYTLTPVSSTISFNDINNNSTTQNFCIAPNGSHQDLEVVIAPITPARPGFSATYEIVYKNKGNTTLPALTNGINLEYNVSKMTLITSSQPVTGNGSGFLHFGYEELHPFEVRVITIVFLINSPTVSNPVNIGDQLSFTVQINPYNNDENTADNVFTLQQIVVGSYDPNDISCLQGTSLPSSEIGKYLHYIVNFENTGNYYAENVVTKLDIDSTKYDINTLQVLNTSHPSYTKITGNKVEFIFEGINLEAAGGNPPVGGHGNVLFKIKSKENLTDGDTVAKRANIYFDYNAPIETNIATTTYQSLSNSVFETDESVTIYPNPTNGTININSTFNIKTIELYDVQGRILETALESSSSTTLNISNRETGIYFLKINTERGSKVEKIVKE